MSARSDHVTVPREVWERLLAEQAEMRARVDRLESPGRLSPDAPASGSPAPDSPDATTPVGQGLIAERGPERGPEVGRRRALLGLAGVAGAGLAGAVAGAAPAAAATGDPVTAGETTTANLTTILDARDAPVAGLRVRQDGGATAISGEATGGIALRGFSSPGLSSGSCVGYFEAGGTGRGLWIAADGTHIRFSSNATLAPPSRSAAYLVGDLAGMASGDLWLCVVSGSPGSWRKVSGPSTAGAFHVLPTPARVYDSRPGTLPAVGSKTKLSGNTPRTLDLKANSSGVPSGATAALVTVLLVNAATGDGNFTIWANSATRPQANSLVWGGSAARFTTLAVTSLDSAARCQVAASASTDLVLDVVGYYR